MSPVRPVHRPRSDFAAADLPVVILDGLELWRVHSRDFPAIRFRNVASHRFSHPDAPEGLLYLGESLETCLWECFGDEWLESQSRLSAGRWRNSLLSQVRSNAPLRICDLTEDKVLLALGVELGSLMHPELSIPQAWGLAIQTHPSAVDGIRYLSRFNHQPSLVLFDRPGSAIQLSETLIGSLPDVPEADKFLLGRKIALV